MSESQKNPFDLLIELFRQVVKEEIDAALKRYKPPVEKDWLRSEELSELYGLPRTWFEERGRQGEIQRCKPGRYVLFARRDVEEYLQRGRQSQ